MRDTMHHRGPDDSGIWTSSDGLVGLGHRRLAIIDLSAAGHQPMCDQTRQYCVVFNGEIYNYVALRDELMRLGHRFSTVSDTEVLLEAYKAWGADCVHKLNGMFAFCVWDPRGRHLFLARDRAGKKPLFYRVSQRGFSFSSELKALLAGPDVPARIDVQALDHFMAYGYVPGSMCIVRGVHKLPRGHAMSYDIERGATHIWEYWRLPEPNMPATAKDEELPDELESLLEDSVRLRMVADVPLGILLSGGLDSSLVAALAARVSPSPVRTFTITFPGHAGHDEGPYARLVASSIGAIHTELAAEPATVDMLPMLAEQFDEPLADSSMVPTYLVSRLIRQHATVALGGDAGDELFGGYPHHSWVQQQELVRALVPGRVRSALRQAAVRLLPPGVKGRNFAIGLTSDLPQFIASTGIFFDEPFRRRLLSPLLHLRKGNVTPEAERTQLSEAFSTPLRKVTSVDFLTYLVDDILVKVDRASMLTSLEVRTPWLDHRIVEFAFSRVPDRLRATSRVRKVLPRLLGKRLLTNDVDFTRKQGFSIPFAAWFKSGWGKFIEDVLADVSRDLFDRRVVQGLLEGQRRGLSNTNRLFAITIFELWRRRYGATL